MSASERLRALGLAPVPWAVTPVTEMKALSDALPLIADYLALVESWRFCPECKYAMENHPTGCKLGQIQKKLTRMLDEGIGQPIPPGSVPALAFDPPLEGPSPKVVPPTQADIDRGGELARGPLAE